MPEMTYDPTPADQPEFSAEELDSLQVGEQLAQAEEQKLAGKYESAEELERAYIELQQKFGERGQEEEQVEEEEYQEEETDYSPAQQVVADASAEWYETGELSEETLQAFNAMSSADLVDAYLSMQDPNNQPAPPAADLSDAEVNQIQNFAGGVDNYNEITGWAAQNMDPAYVDAYDNIIDTGNAAAIQLAMAGLMATYYEQNGYEGQMLSGRSGTDPGAPTFRSQAEVVSAMEDPRYDTDPAYRQDVFDMLERSNIAF